MRVCVSDFLPLLRSFSAIGLPCPASVGVSLRCLVLSCCVVFGCSLLEACCLLNGSRGGVGEQRGGGRGEGAGRNGMRRN